MITTRVKSPAQVLEETSRKLKAERKRAFTEGVWLGLCAGVGGSLGAFWLFFVV